MAPEPAQPTTPGGAPDVTPGAHHTGRRQSGWATSFEHGILCHTAHEEAAEAFFYQQPTEDHGPGGSALVRVWRKSIQTPGIPLPLAPSFFRGGVTIETDLEGEPMVRQRSAPWTVTAVQFGALKSSTLVKLSFTRAPEAAQGAWMPSKECSSREVRLSVSPARLNSYRRVPPPINPGTRETTG